MNYFKMLPNHLFNIDLKKVKNDPKEIMNINNPSEKVQIYVAGQDPTLIQYIKEPCEKAQLVAVERKPECIAYLKEASEKVQLAAINKDPFCITLIYFPAENVVARASKVIESIPEREILEEMQSNYQCFEYIHNPSRKIIDRALQCDPALIRCIPSPSEEIQFKAYYIACEHASYDGGRPFPENTFIGNIQNPTKNVQIRVVSDNPWAIDYMVKPCEEAWDIAIKRDPDYIQLKKSADEKIIFSGGHKQMIITGESAVIRVKTQNFDATDILTGMKNEGIDIRKVPDKTISNFLKGEHVQLPGKNPNNTFTLIKGPAGYTMKARQVAKQLNGMAVQEA